MEKGKAKKMGKTEDGKGRDRGDLGLSVLRGEWTPSRDPEWLVVTCPAGETVAYEEALTERGVRAWTPQMWIRKRVPRRRVRVWVRVSVLPGHLFVPLSDLPKVGMIKDPFKGELRPMKIDARFVVLADKALEGLREFDNRERPRPKQDTPDKPLPDPEPEPQVPVAVWEVGAKVRVKGLLAGAEGVVRGTAPDGKVSVAINYSPTRVLISGFLLERV